jgi:hypothetical protein
MIVGMSDVSYLPGVSGSRPGSRPARGGNAAGVARNREALSNVGRAIVGTVLGALDVPVQAIGGMHRDVIQGAPTGGQSAGSRAVQNYGQQVGSLFSDVAKPGRGQTPFFLPREFDAAGEAAVDRFGLSGAGAGAVRGGATALDLLTGVAAGGVGGAGRGAVRGAENVGGQIAAGANALGDIGVTGANRFVMAAADPAGAQAARGLTEADLMQNPQGLYAAILRNLARHRSKNPYLGLGVKSPEDVRAITGRAGGPGTYFGQSRQASDDAYSSFGENVYRIREPFTEVWNTVRNSPGYITTEGLQRRMPAKVDLNAAEALSLGPATAWDDLLMRQLRDEGYLGYRYADDAFTDWTVGTKPFVGLSRVSGPKLSQELASDFRNKARYELQDPNNPVNRFLINPINDARTGISNVVDTAVRQPIRKVRDARSASQDAYQRALSEYNTAEGTRLAEMYGSPFGGSSVYVPNLRPPAPPGYVPAAPPQQPGPLDFLQYLFNTPR